MKRHGIRLVDILRIQRVHNVFHMIDHRQPEKRQMLVFSPFDDNVVKIQVMPFEFFVVILPQRLLLHFQAVFQAVYDSAARFLNTKLQSINLKTGPCFKNFDNITLRDKGHIMAFRFIM
ncbi:hypothetical protein SDC9_151138 [bioreactor metagenome]|uniref:Uncharacterized protein n=1 Tax=bioreactor metagenome TaxID=1076179 RepID=A0A645ETR0_9ZZZZ